MRPCLALVLGLILPFAFAPYGLWWLAPLTLAGLFQLWRDTTPATAAWRGYLFGLGYLGHGIAWVQISIHQFGLPLYAFSVSMTALFVMFISLYPALAAWLSRRLPAGSELARLGLLAPALWTFSEFARGTLFSGFPWLLVGDSQIDSPLAGFLPVIGAQATTLLLATSAAGLVAAATAARRWPFLVLALLPWAVGAGLRGVEWTAPEGAPESVALVQAAIPQAMKWSPEARDNTLETYARLTEPHWGSKIIVWPETAVPAFPQEIPDYMQALRERARGAGSALLVGLPTAETSERYFNSLLLLGTGEGVYRKHHLVPFGEYLPFDAQLRPALDFLSIPMSGFTPGSDEPVVLRAGALRFGATICYEDAYASEVTRPLPTANVLVNVSNDAWFGDSAAPHQHLQISQVRAAEAGRETLRATNTGISAIIDHHGRVVARSPQFKPYVLTGTITPRSGATPFVILGAGPGLLCGLAMLVAAKYFRGLDALQRLTKVQSLTL